MGPSKLYIAPIGAHAFCAFVIVVMSMPPHALVTAVASAAQAPLSAPFCMHVWYDALSAQLPHAWNVQSTRFWIALPHAVLPVMVA